MRKLNHIKFLAFPVILLTLVSYAYATEGDQLWEKNYTSAGTNWDIAQGATISGNYLYVVGYGTNLAFSNSARDFWIKKFDLNGNEDTTNWNLNFSSPGAGGNDYAWDVAVDSNGNVYVGGAIAQAGTGVDWWIKKFDSNGNEDTTNWNKTFSSQGGSTDVIYNVEIGENDNVYVAGYGYNLTGLSTDNDWWIKKFSPNGVEDTTNWNKNYTSAGSNSDTAHGIAIDSNYNIYVVGEGRNLANAGSVRDWWIKKFYPNGTEYTQAMGWNKNYTSTSQDIAQFAAVDSNDNLVVVGYGTNLAGATNIDWWIKKFQPNGTEITTGWNKNYTSAGSNADIAQAVAIDSYNDVYVAGYGVGLSGATGNDWWIKKFYSNGTEAATLWNKNYTSAGANTDVAYGIAVDGINNIYVVGEGNNITGPNSAYDWWLKSFEGYPPQSTDPVPEFSQLAIVLAILISLANLTFIRKYQRK